jgi:hypothetical protein
MAENMNHLENFLLLKYHIAVAFLQNGVLERIPYSMSSMAEGIWDGGKSV